jgi:hypothetical protein
LVAIVEVVEGTESLASEVDALNDFNHFSDESSANEITNKGKFIPKVASGSAYMDEEPKLNRYRGAYILESV